MISMDFSTYPEPHIVPPKQQPHKQTFIILHGRGDHGRAFAGPFLLYSAGDAESLPSRFPHAKFVFPTASKRRVSQSKHVVMSQWFDVVNFNYEIWEDVQSEGLRESSAYAHHLLRKEINELGGDAKNVFLGGMSQGGSIACVSMLLWDGPAIGAAFALCTRLPFATRMLRSFNADEEAAEDVRSQSKPVEVAGIAERQIALNTLKSAIGRANEADSYAESYREVPMFVAHGAKDHTTWLKNGLRAKYTMTALGANVEWHQYADLDHEYSPIMLGDLAKFIESHSQQDSKPCRSQSS